MQSLMNLLSSWQHFSPLRIVKSIGLVVLCWVLIGCSAPTQASNKAVDSDLEAKVLQVIRNHPEAIVDSVQAYQQKQQEQQQQSQKALLEQMKANPKSVIGDSPTEGNSARQILLLEFSDFQCPYCAQAFQTIKQFMATHQNQVTLVYKNFPLTRIHREAMPAAKAAWAAYQQGKFWPFHDALFENQDKLGESFYVSTAKALNLDMKKFDQDRNSKATEAAIQKDVDMAEKLGIGGTPFFIMDGVPISGTPEIADLEKLLEQVSKS